MTTTLLVTASPVRAASARRGAPRKLFRGVTRTIIRKTLAKVVAIQNGDKREQVRAGTLGYTPHYVTGADRSATENAFARVAERLQQCLDAKEGDE